ncbi:MAG: sugar-binding domain-containing protein, partial [Limisphaerales bacterium]
MIDIRGPAAYATFAAFTLIAMSFAPATATAAPAGRERLLFDSNWLFTHGDPPGTGDELSYSRIKSWMLPAANAFVKDRAPLSRPGNNLGADVLYVQPHYRDGAWQSLSLPHDWGIEGPFNRNDPGDTGKLPCWGVGWYRKHFDIPISDAGRRIYLEVDGAMSYANVWLNGHYVGGWPYGYASWELDLTPYIRAGGGNVIAIRLDNPRDSSRWYPGAGIYRNVWLVKTAPVHVAHWGTYVTTPEISAAAATVKVRFTVDNDSRSDARLSVKNEIHELKSDG